MPSGYISHFTNPKDYFRTAPGFEVTMLGDVRKAFGLKEQLPVEIIDGIPCVYTGRYWSFRRSPKPGFNTVADMVAINYKPTLIPLTLIDKISAYPRDGNELNIHPSNLVWKFSEPLEVPWANGYFYIPGYTRYAISREGNIIRVEDGKRLQKTALRARLSVAISSSRKWFSRLNCGMLKSVFSTQLKLFTRYE